MAGFLASVNAGELELATKHLQVSFAADTGTLRQFLDSKTRFDFVARNTNYLAALWQIELSGQSAPLLPEHASRFQFFRLPGSEPALSLVWDQFNERASGLRVEAVVRLDKAQPLSRWTIRIAGLNGRVLHKIHFPRLPEIAAQPGEHLAVPAWMGQLSAEPRPLLAGPNQRGRRFEWAYPGELSLQCLAWYAEPGTGLYLACDDTAAFRKTVAVFGGPQGTAATEWVHLPENTTPAADAWKMPYSIIVGTFQGDWITAAERYRSWATNQLWARESRLAQGRVPPWVLNTGVWIWNRGRSPGVVDPALALQQKLDLPVSIFWHWWHGCAYDSGFPEYLPPREGDKSFRAALNRAHHNQVHALVYMNQRLWGMTTRSWTERGAERFAVKAPDGKIRPEVYNTFTKDPCVSMCMGTSFWRETYAALADQAVNGLGVDGIYMDQACLSLACYDPAHGHPIGGGRYWVDGFKAMAEDIRHRTAPSNQPRVSRLALAGEGCGEPWLPYLDIMLSLQVSRERYAPPDGWETIPFFHAVYHPYSVTFGNYSSLTMPPYDDLWPAEFAPKEPLQSLDRKFSQQFMLEQARAFVWGQQPTIANFLPSQLTERKPEIDYVLHLARVRSQATNYLLHGTFLRPPRFEIPALKADMSRLSIYAGQQGGLTTFQKDLPRIIAGAWRDPNGVVGIVLASIAAETLPLRFIVDRHDFSLPRRARLALLTEKGRTDLGTLSSNGQVDLQIPARTALFLEIGRK